MSKTIVHVQRDGSVRLEGLASGRAVPKLPKDSFLVDNKDIPGKQDYLVWDSDTSTLKIDVPKKTAYDNQDRRSPFEKLLDEVIAAGIIPPGKKKDIFK